MQQSPGYTFRASIRSAGSTVRIKGEYQAPDRIHQKVRIGSGGPTEVAMIGTQVYERGTDGAWHQTSSSGGTATDPSTNFGVLANARNVSRGRCALPAASARRKAHGAVTSWAFGRGTGRDGSPTQYRPVLAADRRCANRLRSRVHLLPSRRPERAARQICMEAEMRAMRCR
jgi:hypothetical protein